VGKDYRRSESASVNTITPDRNNQCPFLAQSRHSKMTTLMKTLGVKDIPLRDVHKQSGQAIKDRCVEIARQAFYVQVILPLLRSPK
jgi:hypothetical protein